VVKKLYDSIFCTVIVGSVLTISAQLTRDIIQKKKKDLTNSALSGLALSSNVLQLLFWVCRINGNLGSSF
jgi:hypothetical protein